MKISTFWKLINLKLMNRRRGLIMRGLLCWAIGCLVLMNDEVTSYDTRLQIRGDQSVSSQIVLITLHPSDVTGFYQLRSRSFGPLREITDITDSFYWDHRLWSELIGNILKEKPQKIGVTLFFSDSLGPLHLPREELKVLRDPRVVWSASSPFYERSHRPLLSNDLRSNIGSNELLRDEDGVIRRFVPARGDIPHLVEKLTGKTTLRTRFINYRGSNSHFTEYSVRDILDHRISASALTGKIVLIGAESMSSSQYLTPLGPSQRHDVLAQAVDNALEHRWIKRAHNGVYVIGLFFLMLLSVSIMTQYPQSIALVFLIWLATLTASVSAWVFDLYNIWLPAVSPAMQIAATWIIFIGYQANKIERRHWQLKQEQQYLQELEQLKNNFVSLISHDLKTPIAKIQAVVDRMLSQNTSPEFHSDLTSLRVFSEELHRYIQSILKVLRVESRDFRLNKEVGDINDTITEAVNQLTPLAAAKQIRVVTQLEPMFSIEADFTLIREVVVNLIENAIKYTPGGGSIEITSREINDRVLVEVADTGEGISAEEVSKVWRKFVRGKDQDLKTKGTGLGLYLVKYFIELHGGTVSLESEVKRGTKVSFTLPLETLDDKAEEATTEGGSYATATLSSYR
jgi:signal transduction histidine kinase